MLKHRSKCYTKHRDSASSLFLTRAGAQQVLSAYQSQYSNQVLWNQCGFLLFKANCQCPLRLNPSRGFAWIYPAAQWQPE